MGSTVALSNDDRVSQSEIFDPGGTLASALQLDNLMAIDVNDSIVTAEVMARVRVGPFWVMAPTLLDSGASSRNYVSSAFMERHEALMRHCIEEVDTYVTLGDGLTRKPIRRMVTLQLEYHMGYRRQPLRVELSFLEFETTTHELIVGLPDIVAHLTPLFIREVLQRPDLVQGPKQREKTLRLLSGREPPTPQDLEGLLEPWTIMDAPAPELVMDHIPTNYGEVLNLLSTDLEEREARYRELLETHVSAEFLAIGGARQYLLGEAVSVFAHTNWDGARNADGSNFIAKIEWKPETPDHMACRNSFVAHKLMEVVYAELDRLATYHLVRSDSPYASPLVVAAKATPPYVRLCADYKKVNEYMLCPNHPIPVVREELVRLAGYKVFADIDLTNAFHQFRLDEASSRRLAIKTPKGLYQPTFMPEGIAPASLILQNYMRNTFSDLDNVLVIFDNILIMAVTQEELFAHLKTFIERCRHRNLHLKIDKSYIGFSKVTFFGYEISDGAYRMGSERLQGLRDVPFPPTVKAMRSALGSFLFTEPFVQDYSTYAASLHDTTRKDFPYNDESKWTKDYRADFEALKKAVVNALTLFFPNFEVPWYLRTDASEHGVGAILYQVVDGVFQPIYILSHKFSEPATRWSTIQQEAFAIYYACFKLRHWLQAKPFIVESDHANLRFMEQSIQPSIVRHRIFLQSLPMLGIKHIPGKTNTADFPSRYAFEREDLVSHLLVTSSPVQRPRYASAPAPTIELTLSPAQMLRMAHSERGTGHYGARRTWLNVIRLFPQGAIKWVDVWEYVAACPVCQKTRNTFNTQVPVRVQTLNHDPSYRRTICIDLIELETDANGYTYANVISNLMSKSIRIYPQKGKTALEAASSIFSYVVDKGLFDILRSDQGSDYTSTVVTQLCAWLGLEQRWTPIFWPQGSGAERPHGELLRHLRPLLMAEHALGKPWSAPEYYKMVEFIHNNDLSHSGLPEGLSPNMVEMGDLDSVYLRLATSEEPGTPPSPEATVLFVRELQSNLQRIREMTSAYQRDLATRKQHTNPPALHSYQPGDLILVHHSVMRNGGGTKLHPPFMGPYAVIRQERNNVIFRDLNTHTEHEANVAFVKLYVGDPDTAQQHTYVDHDQHRLDSISAYRGEPTTRTSMEFLLHFSDGTQLWRRYEADVYETAAFHTFCNSVHRLRGLLHPAKEENALLARLKKTPIDVAEGYICYPDIRMFGYAWYASLNLPQADTHTYRARAIVTTDHKNRPRFLRDLTFPAFSKPRKLVYVMNAYTLLRECAVTVMPESDTLIDTDFIKRFPALIQS